MATYYVSTSSGGTNSGTMANPWTSLASINQSILTSDDSVLFNRGDVFPGSLIITKSGTSGHPITFGAYGTGANPIITGFSTIGSWTSDGNGVYENTLSAGLSTLNMVTVNGSFQPIGRYPKVSASTASWATGGWLQFQSHSGTSSITSNQIASALSFVGGEVAIRSNHYLINRGLITSQNSTTVNYTVIAGTHTTYEPTDNFGFFFQNHVNTLTTLGDWCYTSASKKLQMYFGDNSTGSYVIKASTVDNLVSISSKSYISFSNISFTGANSSGFNLSATSNIIIDNCDISFCGKYGVYTTNSSCSYTTVTNTPITYCNDSGIYAEMSTHWTIQHCPITYIGMVAGMGISADGSHYSGTANIGDGSLVQYNVVSQIGLSAINYSGAATFQYNFVSDFCKVLDDGTGIGCNSSANNPQVIQSNIVLNGIGAPDGTPDGIQGGTANGIYIDDNSSNITIDSNTVADCQGDGIKIHNASNIPITGNTCYNNGIYQIQFSEDALGSTLIRNTSMSGNIFCSTTNDQGEARFGSNADDILSFGVFDNNFYCYPLASNPSLINVNGSDWYTVSTWQSYSSQDAHSKKSPITVDSVNKIRFEYNSTNSQKVVSLGANYIDVKGNTYSGNLVLDPYTSVVLLQTSTANLPPTSNAGINQTITLPTSSVTLSGSGTDLDGTIASYLWTKISGPSATIVSASSATTSVTGLSAGTYIFQLQVTDNSAATGTSTTTVVVNAAPPVNQPPIANAGSDKNVTLPINNTTLVGNGTDSDGTVAAYSWSQVSGPNSANIITPATTSTQISGLIEGTYVFQLTVTDNLGSTGTDTVSVVVFPAPPPPNQLPTADAGIDKTITLPINNTTLSGSGTDSDGTIVGYLWSQLTGPNTATIQSSSSASTNITGLIAGTYQFQLQVTDNSGGTAIDIVFVVVNPAPVPNQPPTANAGADISIILPVNSVTLSGSGSDPDGSISSYQWSQVSGASTSAILSPNSAQTIINNLIAGSYTFQLKVTDNVGASSVDNINVVVNPAPVPPTPSITSQAENYVSQSGTRKETTSDAGGGQDVAYSRSGNYTTYSVNVPVSGTYQLALRVATISTGAQILFSKQTKTFFFNTWSTLSTINLPNTGGYQSWQTVTVTVSLSAGTQTLRIYANKSKGFNVNYFLLTKI